jgi:hypothetical protein
VRNGERGVLAAATGYLARIFSIVATTSMGWCWARRPERATRWGARGAVRSRLHRVSIAGPCSSPAPAPRWLSDGGGRRGGAPPWSEARRRKAHRRPSRGGRGGEGVQICGRPYGRQLAVDLPRHVQACARRHGWVGKIKLFKNNSKSLTK